MSLKLTPEHQKLWLRLEGRRFSTKINVIQNAAHTLTYECVNVIAAGGEGMILEAKSVNTMHTEYSNQKLAVKIFLQTHDAELMRRRTTVEAWTSNVNRDQSILINEFLGLNYTEDAGVHFIYTNFHNGDLRSQMSALSSFFRPMQVEFLRRFVPRVGSLLLRVLSYLDSKNIRHMDMKSLNILISGLSGPESSYHLPESYPRFQVCDWGHALLFGNDSAVKLQRTLGTEKYRSPEVSKLYFAHPNSDQYSVGLLLQELMIPDNADGDTLKEDLTKEMPYIQTMLEMNPEKRLDPAAFDAVDPYSALSDRELVFQVVSLLRITKKCAQDLVSDKNQTHKDFVEKDSDKQHMTVKGFAKKLDNALRKATEDSKKFPDDPGTRTRFFPGDYTLGRSAGVQLCFDRGSVPRDSVDWTQLEGDDGAESTSDPSSADKAHSDDESPSLHDDSDSIKKEHLGLSHGSSEDEGDDDPDGGDDDQDDPDLDISNQNLFDDWHEPEISKDDEDDDCFEEGTPEDGQDASDERKEDAVKENQQDLPMRSTWDSQKPDASSDDSKHHSRRTPQVKLEPSVAKTDPFFGPTPPRDSAPPQRQEQQQKRAKKPESSQSLADDGRGSRRSRVTRRSLAAAASIAPLKSDDQAPSGPTLTMADLEPFNRSITIVTGVNRLAELKKKFWVDLFDFMIQENCVYEYWRNSCASDEDRATDAIIITVNLFLDEHPPAETTFSKDEWREIYKQKRKKDASKFKIGLNAFVGVVSELFFYPGFKSVIAADANYSKMGASGKINAKRLLAMQKKREAQNDGAFKGASNSVSKTKPNMGHNLNYSRGTSSSDSNSD
eukprot:TRINITY_DN6396_c0_g1_i1.p1 TRINITY_DN6396_c0_g1~~TRINITY_DN6396_c0_g1_i1.p1  ORF type:complete len:834 (+),score=143.91 TRINITY_DN6396_c0_g1_i1:89-2590(+)